MEVVTVDGSRPTSLTAYNLSRPEIAKAALAAKCEPTQVSFTRVFHIIQFE